MLYFKHCNQCGEKKEAIYFVKNKGTSDGLLGICKECHNGNRRKNRVYTQKDLEYNKAYIEDKPELRMLWSAKTRAKKQKLPFNIEVSDIVIPEYCPYLGIKLTQVVGKGWVPTNPSLDKIIPHLGYVKGNVEVISCKANAMKQNATIEELIYFSNSIYKKYQETVDSMIKPML